MRQPNSRCIRPRDCLSKGGKTRARRLAVDLDLEVIPSWCGDCYITRISSWFAETFSDATFYLDLDPKSSSLCQCRQGGIRSSGYEVFVERVPGNQDI